MMPVYSHLTHSLSPALRPHLTCSIAIKNLPPLDTPVLVQNLHASRFQPPCELYGTQKPVRVLIVDRATDTLETTLPGVTSEVQLPHFMSNHRVESTALTHDWPDHAGDLPWLEAGVLVLTWQQNPNINQA